MNDFFGSLLFMGVPSKEKFSVSVVVRDKKDVNFCMLIAIKHSFFRKPSLFVQDRIVLLQFVRSVVMKITRCQHPPYTFCSHFVLFFLFCFVLAKSVEMTL